VTQEKQKKKVFWVTLQGHCCCGQPSGSIQYVNRVALYSEKSPRVALKYNSRKEGDPRNNLQEKRVALVQYINLWVTLFTNKKGRETLYSNKLPIRVSLRI
jgi:hypothetical protein